MNLDYSCHWHVPNNISVWNNSKAYRVETKIKDSDCTFLQSIISGKITPKIYQNNKIKCILQLHMVWSNSVKFSSIPM